MFFLLFLLDPYLVLMDPDAYPRSPKTSGSYGSGSATLRHGVPVIRNTMTTDPQPSLTSGDFIFYFFATPVRQRTTNMCLYNKKN